MSDVEDSVDQGTDGAPFSVPRARACEACRSRKIRCDKKTPCSNCKQLKIPCRAAKPPSEKRQRVLISGRYEEQVERIYTHIQRLDATLQELLQVERGSAARRSPNTISPSLPVNSNQSSTSSPRVDSLTDEISYQNEPSFNINSELTSQLLEKALGNSSSSQLTKDTSTALNSLFDFLKTNKTTDNASFSHDMSLPNLDLSLKALRLVTQIPRQNFFFSVSIVDTDKFKEYSQKIFFPIESYSICDFIIVHGGLSWILRETPQAELRQYNISREEAEEASQLCIANVLSAVDQLSPFLSPNLTNLTALNAAAQMALQQSKPSLAWNLTCYACRLCLNAGIHRLKRRAGNKEDEAKIRIFWAIYGLEKSMSLNFGLSPNIFDYDVTIEPPTYPADPFNGGSVTWTDLAQLQSRIYVELFSGKALERPQDERATVARNLGAELKSILDRYTEIKNSVAALSDPFLTGAIEITEVFIHTHLTLVYRALPTPGYNDPLRFNEECIAVARKTLERHSTLVNSLKEQGEFHLRLYIDWSLMLSPFTPFNVVLGTAITETSREDMELLEKAIKCLEDTCSQHSAGAQRLYQICSTLYRGAKAIVDPKLNGGGAPEGEDYRMGDAAAVNPGVSYVGEGQPLGQGAVPRMQPGRMDTMGLHNANNMGQGLPAPVPLDNANDMSMLFDNYLSGNAGMMDLFEGDFGLFEFQ